jgi:hypothetical protein
MNDDRKIPGDDDRKMPGDDDRKMPGKDPNNSKKKSKTNNVCNEPHEEERKEDEEEDNEAWMCTAATRQWSKSPKKRRYGKKKAPPTATKDPPTTAKKDSPTTAKKDPPTTATRTRISWGNKKGEARNPQADTPDLPSGSWGNWTSRRHTSWGNQVAAGEAGRAGTTTSPRGNRYAGWGNRANGSGWGNCAGEHDPNRIGWGKAKPVSKSEGDTEKEDDTEKKEKAPRKSLYEDKHQAADARDARWSTQPEPAEPQPEPAVDFFGRIQPETDVDSDDETFQNRPQYAAAIRLTQSRGWRTTYQEDSHTYTGYGLRFAMGGALGAGWYIGLRGLEVDLRLLDAQHRGFSMSDEFDPSLPENREPYSPASTPQISVELYQYLRTNGILVRDSFGRLFTWSSDEDSDDVRFERNLTWNHDDDSSQECEPNEQDAQSNGSGTHEQDSDDDSDDDTD